MFSSNRLRVVGEARFGLGVNILVVEAAESRGALEADSGLMKVNRSSPVRAEELSLWGPFSELGPTIFAVYCVTRILGPTRAAESLA